MYTVVHKIHTKIIEADVFLFFIFVISILDVIDATNYGLIRLRGNNNCNVEGFHITCDKIIKVPPNREIHAARQDLSDDFCKHIYAEPSRGIIGNQHVPICLQHQSVVDAVIEVNSAFEYAGVAKESHFHNVTATFTKGKFEIISRKVVLQDQPYEYIPGHDYPLSGIDSMPGADNYGNWVWIHGAMNLLHPQSNVIVSSPVNTPPGTSISAIALGFANALVSTNYPNEAYKAGVEAQLAARLKIAQAIPNVPVAVLSLGLQAEFGRDETNIVEVLPSQMEFLKTVSAYSKSPNIAVRGRLTSQACPPNTCVAVGCPSYFLNSNPILGEQIELQWRKVATALMSDEQADLVVGIAMPSDSADAFDGLYKIYAGTIHSVCSV
jgi:hypothetical protein